MELTTLMSHILPTKIYSNYHEFMICTSHIFTSTADIMST